METKGQFGRVGDLEGRDELAFVDDHDEVAAVQSSVEDAEEYDAFFIDTENGDYSEVWGMHGKVPALGRPITRLV